MAGDCADTRLRNRMELKLPAPIAKASWRPWLHRRSPRSTDVPIWDLACPPNPKSPSSVARDGSSHVLSATAATRLLQALGGLEKPLTDSITIKVISCHRLLTIQFGLSNPN